MRSPYVRLCLCTSRTLSHCRWAFSVQHQENLNSQLTSSVVGVERNGPHGLQLEKSRELFALARTESQGSLCISLGSVMAQPE